ncbi:DUF503 domain-containing protein [Thalassorhabdus alkalitolerans]|uniref:DUF503 domain-containing protein n=1 Tax=Thalassorhabdus alkalitolerans TaxID=2282697 RepID=A0ABW0YKU3_9BACI|nr:MULTISPECIES: DUF503 domain-containing protein [Bacillaceae]
MIGVVHCECFIYEAGSLKEKRSVLQSLVTRLRQRLNVSVAEVDHQNVWQRTALSIVCVGSEKEPVERELQRALSLIDGVYDLERTVTTYEWL